ncbi:LAQU0S04e04302g1_1 [Lachancea quebecensis]|uniref:LAQU0S04e04302g1_1 n=1 Tax=Lachancea quebecensis TaxID=1654605 RepID=A0A0P1KQI4_9SACH|nr:LAQU0S04e04302g1_1 [Lachancea quebecensis]
MSPREMRDGTVDNSERDELLNCLNEWSKNTGKIRCSTLSAGSFQSHNIASKTEDENLEQRRTDARSIFLRNIPVNIPISVLEDHFRLYGTIYRVTVFTNRKNSNLGYAYIEFGEEHSADASLELNNSDLCGHKIEVTKKRTNLPGMRRKSNKIINRPV